MLSLSNCLVQKFSFIGLVWYDFNEPKKTRFYRALISLIFDLFVSYEFHCVDLAVCGLTKIVESRKLNNCDRCMQKYSRICVRISPMLLSPKHSVDVVSFFILKRSEIHASWPNYLHWKLAPQNLAPIYITKNWDKTKFAWFSYKNGINFFFFYKT